MIASSSETKDVYLRPIVNRTQYVLTGGDHMSEMRHFHAEATYRAAEIALGIGIQMTIMFGTKIGSAASS